jgi:hypothetical protein
MENHQKEVSFISQSILYSVLRGIIVGIAAGLVVVVFRLAIEKLFGVFSHLYPLATQSNLFTSYWGLIWL